MESSNDSLSWVPCFLTFKVYSRNNCTKSNNMPQQSITTASTDDVNQNVNQKLLKADLNLMFKHAIECGKELPTNFTLSGEDNATLIGNYNALRKVIQPATVESIRYINSQMLKKGPNSKWFEIPIFTNSVIIAGIALIVLIGISLSPIVNEANQARGLLESSGVTLLYNLIFICAASLLGVMFYLLKTFGDKIKNYTLVIADAVELNAKIIIGVISGFVISELFAFTLSDMSNEYIEIHKMTLALLGGFSSDAIFSILKESWIK